MSRGTVRTIGPRLVSSLLVIVVLTFVGAHAAWAGLRPSPDVKSQATATTVAAATKTENPSQARYQPAPAASAPSDSGGSSPTSSGATTTTTVTTSSNSTTSTSNAPNSYTATSSPPSSSNTVTASAAGEQVDHPGDANVLEPEQIAVAAQKAGFSGHNLVTAVAVAMAESSGDADVVNSIHAYGLWQVLAAAHPDLIRSSDPDSSRWFDPYTNAKFAWEISNQGRDWTPWEAYTNGAYSKYMGDARAAVDLLVASPQAIQAPVAK
jgi:hypothetical protein